MSLFHKITIHFPTIDPLANGLAEEIAAERAEPDAITLDDAVDANELQQRWSDIAHDFEQDPDWVELTKHDHE